MPRVDVPDGVDPLLHVWGSLAVGLTRPAAMLSHAVYADSTLTLREFEAARAQIASVNDCQICLGWRSARDVPSRANDADPPGEDFYAAIGDPTWPGFSTRERLSMTFAEKFAVDHLSIDDAMWAELHAAFSDDELVELAVCVGSWLASGRLNRVFDIDGACRVPLSSDVVAGG